MSYLFSFGGKRVVHAFALGLLFMSGARAGEEDPIFSRLMLLSSTDDVSASSFRTRDGMQYDRWSLPYTLTERALSVRLQGNYFRVRGERLDIGEGAALIPRWDVYAATVTGDYTRPLSAAFSLKGGLTAGYIRMENRSQVRGEAWLQGGARDSGLAGGYTQRRQLSPHAGMEYRKPLNAGDTLTLDAELSWNVLADLHDSPLRLTGAGSIGTWSALAEYRFANVLQVHGISADILVAAHPGGFWGSGYRKLDFGFMQETTLAAEWPLRMAGHDWRLRTGAGWLVNDTGQGFSLVLSVQ